MSKTDGQRPKSSHFRFTSEKLRWSGGNMFTSLSDTIIFFVIIISSTLDDFGRNMFTIHTIFLKCEIHMSGIIFSACPSILAANEGYLRRGAYSRHIGLDKRLTELSAIISQNAKAAEILASMQWSVRTRLLTSQKKKTIIKGKKGSEENEQWWCHKFLLLLCRRNFFHFPAHKNHNSRLWKKRLRRKTL